MNGLMPPDIHHDVHLMQVLHAYQNLDTQTRQAESKRETQDQEKFDGWLPRLFDVGEIEGEELSRIHGRLIAYGLLKFQIAGRVEGMNYQLTTQAVRLLTTPAEPAA